MRHGDHLFEWTREEFCEWAENLFKQYDYTVAFYSIGSESSSLGLPTQMGVFKRAD